MYKFLSGLSNPAQPVRAVASASARREARRRSTLPRGVGGQSGDIFVGAIFEIEGVANKAGRKRARPLARRTRVTDRRNRADLGKRTWSESARIYSIFSADFSHANSKKPGRVHGPMCWPGPPPRRRAMLLSPAGVAGDG